MRQGDASVYGAFPGQWILGQSVILTYERLDDADLRCVDLLGSVLSRGQAVMHISGLNHRGEVLRRCLNQRAIRRLLEDMLNISNQAGGSLESHTLVRYGRWRYRFRPSR